MQKWETSNGTTVFRVSSGRSNAYLISTGKNNILVDTGWRFSFNGLKKNIGSLKLTKPITHLILTHTHFDHCYNTFLIRQEENCMIISGEQEAEFAKAGYTPIPAGTLIRTKLLSIVGNLIGARWFGYPPFLIDQSIRADLDFLMDESDIRVISTSGHSIGSSSIIVNDEIAIVGDTMLGHFHNSIFIPFADDIEETICSWGKLLKTGCHIFLPGHGREIRRELLQIEYEKYSRKYNLNILQSGN